MNLLPKSRVPRPAPFVVLVAILGSILGSKTLTAQSGVPQWTVGPKPIVDLGGASTPQEEFNRVPRVLRLRNGTIVVPNEGTKNLRFFDGSGRYLRTVGRDGSGPGEFRSVQSTLRKAGDSILVWDWSQRRLTLLAPDGRVVKTLVLSPPAGHPRIPQPVAVFSDGSLLGVRVTNSGFPFPGREGEIRTDSAVLVRFTTAGTVSWTSPALPHHDNFGMPGKAGNVAFMAPMNLPFGAQLSWATLGDSVLYGTGRAAELTILGPSGAKARSLSTGSTTTSLSPSAIQKYTHALEEFKASGGPSVHVYEEVLAAVGKKRVPFPSALATHGAIIVDDSRMVWIQDGDPTGFADGGLVSRSGSRWWTVRSTDGRTVARVEMPERFRVDGIGADYAIGVWRDNDDVEHVRVYSLARKPATR